MTKATRRYGGQSQERRVEERREKLMRAAAALYGRLGPAGASVTAICAEAGLTPRYFYESFLNREALLLAVFGAVCERLLEQIGAAIDPADPAASGVRAFFGLLAEHPDLARVFLVEAEHDDAAMRAVGRATMIRFAEMLMPDGPDALAKAGAIGAILRMARFWIEDGRRQPAEAVAVLAERFVAIGSAADDGTRRSV
jgi:AcrR family transcriptional regulator